MSKRKLMRQLITLWLIMSASVQSTYADSCQPLIEAADKAIAAQARQIEIRDLRIRQVEDRMGEVLKERDYERESKESFWRSPTLHLFLGMALGVALVKKIN